MLIPLIISLLPFGEPLPRTNFALTVPLNPINIRVRECIAGIVGTYSQQEGAIIIIARIYADGEIKISPFEIPLYLIRAVSICFRIKWFPIKTVFIGKL